MVNDNAHYRNGPNNTLISISPVLDLSIEVTSGNSGAQFKVAGPGNPGYNISFTTKKPATVVFNTLENHLSNEARVRLWYEKKDIIYLYSDIEEYSESENNSERGMSAHVAKRIKSKDGIESKDEIENDTSYMPFTHDYLKENFLAAIERADKVFLLSVQQKEKGKLKAFWYDKGAMFNDKTSFTLNIDKTLPQKTVEELLELSYELTDFKMGNPMRKWIESHNKRWLYEATEIK